MHDDHADDERSNPEHRPWDDALELLLAELRDLGHGPGGFDGLYGALCDRKPWPACLEAHAADMVAMEVAGCPAWDRLHAADMVAMEVAGCPAWDRLHAGNALLLLSDLREQWPQLWREWEASRAAHPAELDLGPLGSEPAGF